MIIENLHCLECAILNTYLMRDSFCDYNKLPDLPKLKVEDFNYHFHKKIAEEINKELSGNNALGILSYKIQDSCAGTRYENDFLEILAQNTLPFKAIKGYLSYLTEKRIEKELEL